MSGQDDHPEPEARRPRRPPPRKGKPRRRRGGSGRGITFDRRLLLMAIAAVVLVVVLIFAVRQCQRDQLVNSYKGYVSDVSTIVDDSSGQGKSLLMVLNNEENKNPMQLRQDVRQIAEAAEKTRENAEDLDPPGSLDSAHRSLLVALGFRARGLSRLADDLPTILQNNDEAEIASQVASSMQRFLASDVLYQDSFLAPAKVALEEDEIVDVDLPEGDGRTKFLPGGQASLASASGARGLVTRLKTGGGGGGGNGGGQNNTDPGSNLKGVALESVEALPSGTRLVPGEVVSVTSSEDFRWRVTISNGGDFVETGVKITAVLSFEGAEDEPREGTIASIEIGETASVELAGPSLPRFDTGTLVVRAVPVPGETRTENNEASYSVKFN